MKYKTVVQTTSDGVDHPNTQAARDHLNRKLDDLLRPMAHKLSRLDSYVSTLEYLYSADVDVAFRRAAAIRDDLGTLEDEDS